MEEWKKHAVGDLPLYQATAMNHLPGAVQGFTTRRGGISLAPYDSLNLGDHVGDSPESVKTNRQRVWTDLGFDETQVAFAEQVHGDQIAVVDAGNTKPVPGVDALVTDTPDVLLMLFFADCVPVYLVDPVCRAGALIHAGWRGAAANIVGKTAARLRETYGSQLSLCLAAIGPCIAGDSYNVGRDVADRFRNFGGGLESGAATVVLPRDEMGGKYTLNLRQVIFAQLLSAGFRAGAISVSTEDTFRNRRDFFSHRRDGTATGRMAAFLAFRPRA